MAEFVVNSDIATDVPSIEVTLSPDRPLPVGRHRFRLTVVDDSGNQSQPDVADVIVADQVAPTAVLTAPPVVSFGTSFQLDGRRSFDAGGGRITRYIWTYLGPA